jgi:hypothetical protein
VARFGGKETKIRMKKWAMNNGEVDNERKVKEHGTKV